jgi:hypothetical protein
MESTLEDVRLDLDALRRRSFVVFKTTGHQGDTIMRAFDLMRQLFNDNTADIKKVGGGGHSICW